MHARILCSARSGILAVAVAVGCTPPAAAQAPVPEPTAEQWRADLRYLVRQLEWRHRNLYHTINREQFASAVADLDRRIPQLKRHQIIVEMMRLAAMVGDGHTNLYPHRAEHARFRSLPVMFYPFDDGLYIRAAAPSHAELAGARVEAIGGVPISEALARLDRVISRDNPVGARLLIPYYVRMPDILHALGLAPSRDAAVLRLRKGTRTWTATVPAGGIDPPIDHDTEVAFVNPPGWVDARSGAAPIWLAQNPREHLFRMVELPAEKALYAQVNEVGRFRNESLGDFGRRIRKRAEETGAQRIILDLRLARGGGAQHYPAFVRELIRADDDDTDLFVLIGRGTYSATQFLTDHLNQFSEAVLIGEPTGSKPNHYSDSRLFKVPNSGIEFGASARWWQLGDPGDNSPWTAPDVGAPLTFAYYAAGRDPALEAAVNYQPGRPRLRAAILDAVTKRGWGSLQEAIDAFTAQPDNRYVDVEQELLEVGASLLNQGRREEGEKAFERAVQQFPHSAKSHYWLAFIQRKTRPDEARRLVALALRLNPHHDRAKSLAEELGVTGLAAAGP